MYVGMSEWESLEKLCDGKKLNGTHTLWTWYQQEAEGEKKSDGRRKICVLSDSSSKTAIFKKILIISNLNAAAVSLKITLFR